MDNTSIQSAILGAASTIISAGVVVLQSDSPIRNYIPREPYVTQDIVRERFMHSILFKSEQHCINQIRMKPIVFFRLCHLLTEKSLLHKSRNMSIREQVLMFLHVIGHNVRFRVIGGRFHRSTDTVHRYFKIVLKAILKLYKLVIRQPNGETPIQIRNSQRFYPYFENCVGALDGTHIRAKVPNDIEGKFRGRKGGTTQNVLAAIAFDLKFTYVLAGWEGTAHDSRVLNDALTRPQGFKIPEDMVKTQDGKTKQFRWTRPMERVFFEILSDEVRHGNKPSSTFKHSSFVRVAKAINEKFSIDVECLPIHVDNHLRTVKGVWNTLSSIRGKSGFGWNNSLHMITIEDQNVYDQEVAAHPTHAKYVNRKIDMYEEMTIIVGIDIATGSFPKSFADIDMQETEVNSPPLNDNDDILSNGKQDSSSEPSSRARSHRKRNRDTESMRYENLAKQIGQVAEAINKLSDDKFNEDLYKEVMKIEGFDEVFL